jgi:Ubiquitin C-terminal hydrolase
MNSALQCLSNIPELTEYFLSLRYKDDINEENPLGSQGKIARKFAFLLKKLWLDNEKYFAPHSFKFAMSKYQTMVLHLLINLSFSFMVIISMIQMNFCFIFLMHYMKILTL